MVGRICLGVFCFAFKIWPHRITCGIPDYPVYAGTQAGGVKAQTPNPWPTREFPGVF